MNNSCSKMRELDRLSSFALQPDHQGKVFPHSCLNLAHVGFIYVPYRNQIQCCHCAFALNNCRAGDNIKHKHRLNSPECPFVTGADIDVFEPWRKFARVTTETDHCEALLRPNNGFQCIFEQVLHRAEQRGVLKSNREIQICLDNPEFDVLRRECIRLATFQNWPTSSHIAPDLLAKDGFFYTGTADRVQCAFCRSVHENWALGDIPLLEHRKNFPDCPFVRELGICFNISKEDDLLDECVKVFSSSISYHCDSIVTKLTIDEAIVSPLKEKPKHPDMICESTRKATFSVQGAVIPKGQNPDLLAEAGFYFVGPGDYCKCFFCDGGLRNWQRDDDPWSEHARWYPRCMFIKSKQSSEFITTAQNARSARLQQMQPRLTGTSLLPLKSSSMLPSLHASVPVVTTTLVKQEASADITTPISQYQSDLQSNPKGKGKNKKKKNKKGTQSAIEKQMMTSQEETTKVGPENIEQNEMESTNNSLSPEDIEVKSLQEENQMLKDARTCKICMEREVNTVFLPCGHLVCCHECAPALKHCAICRELIRGTVKTFLA